MKSNLTKLAAAGALTLFATAAFAGSMTQPGITIGGSDAPLPPGLYFIDTIDWGVRDATSGGAKTAVGVHAPVLAWATPWQILGARLSFAVAVPSVEVGIGPLGSPAGNTYAHGMFNPFFGGSLNWNLGNGFAFGYTAGAYVRLNSEVAADTNTFEQRFGLTYLGFNGWNLRANLIYGINDTPIGHTLTVGTNGAINSDYVNVDFHAIKNFGKWEVGGVGFYSADVTQPLFFVPKQKQLALGALLGYNWGPVITQAYVTRDVWQEGYGGFDTRVWGRIIVPLGDPFAPAPSVMYRK